MNNSNYKIKVLFFAPYPTEGASTRYRVVQYIPFLESQEIKCDVRPFASPELFSILYKKGMKIKKMYLLAKAIFNRILDVINAKNYDVIFIHREVFPFGPAFFEWILSKMNKPLIYDFDDAIYIPDNPERKIMNFLKNHKKVPEIIKLCNHTIVCNEYLKQYSEKYNKNITIIPTSVDTDKFSMKEYPKKLKTKKDEIVLGWIGSHSTTKYLHKLTTVFEKLSKKYKIKVVFVGANENFTIPGVNIVNKKWELSTEINEFKSFDIGVYPLDDDEWVLGKTGFKTIQYMAVGVPSVVSNVGTNKYIVKDEINGMHAYSEKEWVNKISELIEKPELRKKIAIEGRKTALKGYSVEANKHKVLEVIKSVFEREKQN